MTPLKALSYLEPVFYIAVLVIMENWLGYESAMLGGMAMILTKMCIMEANHEVR